MGWGSRAQTGLALVLTASLVTATFATPANAQRGGARPASGSSSLSAAPVDVETAEQLYAKLDYEQANAVAERVVKKTGLTHDQLVRAYRVLAVTYAVLDKEEQARDAFLQLLTYDADYQADPNLGPKVNTPFAEARGSFRSLPSKPGIEVAATISTGGGNLRVTTRDPTRIVKKVVVGYRWTSSGEYTITQLNQNEAVAAVEVSPAPAGRTRLDFYVQALDERDNAVLEAGNANVPKSAFAEAGARGGGAGGGGGKDGKSEGGSVFSSPVFWLIAGAAVVGGGTALFFALRPQEPPSSAALSPVIRCGADRCN
jgi:lipoprotein-anchoring transpeptidase ErfK/SrfK